MGASRRWRITWNSPVSNGVTPIATSVPVATPTRVIDARKLTWKTAWATPAPQTARLRSTGRIAAPRRVTATTSHISEIATASRTRVIADAPASSGPSARAVPMVPNSAAAAQTIRAGPSARPASGGVVTSGGRPLEHGAGRVGTPYRYALAGQVPYHREVVLASHPRRR